MKRKYTIYTMDKDNRFLKDCFHMYFDQIRDFDDHFSEKELLKLDKVKKRKEQEKLNELKKKSHKYLS